MHTEFCSVRSRLEEQFRNTEWIAESGLATEDIEAAVTELEREPLSRKTIKAKTFELIAQKARIAVDRYDIFQDKLQGAGIMQRQRARWEREVKREYLSKETAETGRAWSEAGAYFCGPDYGHTSPNTRLMLSVGLPGLLDRVEAASKRSGLSGEQRDYYAACRTALTAVMTAAERLADAVEPFNAANSAALRNIACRRPENIYEALQLIVLYYFLHDFVAGTRIRTLGRLDVLLEPFYRRDIENGTFSRDEVREMLRFFLYKFWSADVVAGLPFTLGGSDGHGGDVTSEISYLIVETYNELNIYSPKIQIRISEKTPEKFIRLVLSCIRGGNSGFVFMNDSTAIRGLVGVGVAESDAWDYVPVGCYEPAVWGKELGCTASNGGVSLPKAVELVFTNGRDKKSGELCGVETGEIGSYEEFVAAVKKQIAYMTEKATDYVVRIERHYREINPDPLLSCQYTRSVETGVDVYEGGAEYNNSSMCFFSIASLTDAVCAVRRLVFEEKRFSFGELGDILKNNWEGYEMERRAALCLPEKYGCGNSQADAVAAEFADFCAALVNNLPNGRGGVFKAALFTIDFCFYTGERTMATPDGRLEGEPLSKNLCAVTGMDREGVTALIRSAAAINASQFPDGSVLDVVLHPSAVSGEEGLAAFRALLAVYFKLGGLAIHGNVFDAEDLKKAQREPEKYRNLQVRVCGWNAYFIDLSRAEQDAFIRQAENAV